MENYEEQAERREQDWTAGQGYPEPAEDRGAVLVGADAISYVRLATLRGALKLELRGLKRSRGLPSAYKLLKQAGYAGSKQEVLDRVEADLKAKREALVG